MSNYRIGIGVHDITGPVAECGMMGYSMPGQRTAGLHMRLWSRAFIVGTDAARIVYVTAECGQLFQGVSLAVLEQLKASFGSEYTEANVCLTATHTHSGPGGYSHYTLYNIGTMGYDGKLFETIVHGIVESIRKAHRNFSESNPGTIRIIEGELADCGFNRSASAYLRNPLEERALYEHDTNRTMTVLRLEDEHGSGIGMLNWFAVHPTSLGNRNTLVSSDNKGYAAYLFEKERGRDHEQDAGFIAGFAQSECGDVSANYHGHPDNIHDFERMEEIGKRQYLMARELYDRAQTELEGEVDCRHLFIDMEHIEIEPTNMQESELSRGGEFHTCSAAVGLSTVAGSMEDGRGIVFIHEGMTYDGLKWPEMTLDPDVQRCHREKVILASTGTIRPNPWTPSVLPIQLLRIGQLVLAALPAECTTMAARRLKKVIRESLPGAGVVILAAYANAYSGYVTTREEYSAQHYEGASTLYGPYTLNAYQQEFRRLALAMKTGVPVYGTVRPPDRRDEQVIIQPGVILDLPPLFGGFGRVSTEPNAVYSRGERVVAVFWGAHPKNNYMTQGTFLEVQKSVGYGWLTVARDRDPETILRWRRVFPAMSRITVEWTIPPDAGSGEYRILHRGHRKGGKPYEGISRTFVVE